MTSFTSIKNTFLAFFTGWKLRSWRTAAVAAVIIAIAAFLALRGGETASEPEAGLREVSVIAVSEYGQGALGVAIPTANGNSFVIRSEAGGKVTSAARTGPVAQGAVVAQLENSAQRAALTQAEGVYEAAVAASGGNATSQESARQAGVRTWTSATVAAAETVRTSIDGYFATARGTYGSSGFRLEAFGSAEELNGARTSIEAIFDRWERENVTDSDAASALGELSSDLAAIGALVDKIAALVPRQTISNTYSEEDRAADAASIAAARASITAQQQAVDGARTAITSASQTGDASAQAQVKQALGSLQAARSSYEKTIVRAPFAGTITSMNAKNGDVISVGSDIAIIVPREGVATERSFALPLSAVKYTPAGAFVFLVTENGTLEARAIETGLVTAERIEASGLIGDEMIVADVRGLKAGEKVEVVE